MLVASHIEYGDQAIAAMLPQIIGNIHTVIGCGTLRRAGCAAVQIMVGDPVCQGDEIETESDGQIGIRFIDGTQFMLSRSTRVVLDEFVCDGDGISRSALFAIARGTFAFIAGRMSTAGSFRIDTPVGNIRGRAHAGGFGMLSLTALTFATMSDVKAADPSATFLDDDNITYKDLEHGVFELWTKEAIPRHVIVEDPAETVVLTRRGSSVSVNQVANSAARMEELQAAQQAVLANFAKGYGPNGSSTPYYLNLPLLQPINYTQPDGPTPLGQLPPLPVAPNPIYEVTIIKPPPPPPTLNVGPRPTLFDTVVFDTFSTSCGTFLASSSESDATLTFSISDGTAGNTVVDGVTFDVSRTVVRQTELYGTLYLGTLYLNSTTGAYCFVPNSDAINALKTPTIESFTITVSDGTLSTSQAFTVTFNGVEDAAIISGTTTGSVIEIRGVINATPDTQTVTGTLTDTDPDDPPNTFTAVTSPTASDKGYGTFTMTAAGLWIYTLDDTNSAVQALKVGDTLTDTFTVTSIDGTPQVVTITIHGPLVATTGTAPSLTLSETHLTATVLDDNVAGSAPNAALTTTSANFSTAFTSVQGVDGATISYALSITGGDGTASGLIDSHTGLADVLVLNGNTIEGHVGTTDGTLAFTVTVDSTTGLVTFTEYRAVTQSFGTNPDGGEGASLTAGIVNLTATITDKDGVFQTASIDLGSRLAITDDGSMIAAAATAPSLTLSETHLTATALDDNVAGSAPNAALTTISGDFSTAFTSVQGADGATISYALSITGGDGTASGLIDSHTGLADVLVLKGNTIEGRVGTTSGPLAFTIELDPTTGLVTFTEYRAVTQPLGTNPDGGEDVPLTAGIVNLTATITDTDGDFQTASVDLGSRLTITDDGPTIGDFSNTTILAKDEQVADGTYTVSFGADGDGTMRVAIHDGAVGSTGYNLATTDLGGGITSVHVTGNGDDYTFYYTTHAVNGGVELNAFFTDTSGTLSDPYFTLLINPDGTYTFDIQTVGFLQQTTVSGSDFGASSSGQPSLTAPDGLLVITGDFNGAPADVKASNNGIAVGDSGLQMDQHETLLLTFTPEQTDVSFHLTQWQGNGTANVVFKVYDGATDIHDFNINIPKPSGDALIVVETTSNPALVNTYTFDSATSTYTLYVGSEFNQIGVSYDHEVTGNATFTVNNITYSEGTSIPSTDLLFDVTAVDRDGDISTTSLQVDLLGGILATGLTLSATSGIDVLAGDSGNDTLASTTADGTAQLATITINGTNDAADLSGTTTGSVTESGGVTNGNDTIIGGYDGDKLTGSNGDDTFVYLSAADSNSFQFDTILDFVSGSDKINLMAFGELAFMALTPTSTSVPPHTLAWIYDGASNQTIVYVNPTDQTLDIGDSALLEIHLQGTVSIAESNFVYEHATTIVVATNEAIDPALQVTTASDGTVLTTGTADLSIDASVSESGRIADGGWTMPVDEGFSFLFARDRVDSFVSAKLASFSETPPSATEDSDDGAVSTAASVSIEIQHSHTTLLAEDHFTFNQGQVHASANAMVICQTAVVPAASTIEYAATNATAELQLAEHGAMSGSGTSHGQSQHEAHTASASASATAELQLAEHGATSGSGASHGQSQHEAHAASANAAATAELQLAELGATSGSGASHGQSQHAALGLGESFRFSNEIIGPEHSGSAEVAEMDVPASIALAEGIPGPHEPHATIPEVEDPSLAQANHGSAAQHHAAIHGAHELMV